MLRVILTNLHSDERKLSLVFFVANFMLVCFAVRTDYFYISGLYPQLREIRYSGTTSGTVRIRIRIRDPDKKVAFFYPQCGSTSVAISPSVKTEKVAVLGNGPNVGVLPIQSSV